MRPESLAQSEHEDFVDYAVMAQAIAERLAGQFDLYKFHRFSGEQVAQLIRQMADEALVAATGAVAEPLN